MKAVVIRTFDRASQARKAAARERIVTLKAEASGALRSGLSALNATIDRRAYLVGCVEAVRLALALEVGACEAGSILAKEAGEAFGRLGAQVDGHDGPNAGHRRKFVGAPDLGVLQA